MLGHTYTVSTITETEVTIIDETGADFKIVRSSINDIHKYFLIQYGYGVTNSSILFPQTFTTICGSLTCSYTFTEYTPNNIDFPSLNIGYVSTSGFVANNIQYPSTNGIYFISIGY